MTFAEFVDVLSKEIGGEIETEGATCAVRTGADGQQSVTILMQGFDERGALLMTADLGQPPPEKLQEIIHDGNRRLHAEGKRRGLALAGREEMYPREYNDNSIKEIPKLKKNIIDIASDDDDSDDEDPMASIIRSGAKK